MTILILGDSADEHATHMCDTLRQRGADAVHIDGSWFPKSMTIDFDPAAGRGEIGLPDGRLIPLDRITAVYWRNYDGVGSVPLPDPEQRSLAENDARGLFESLLIWLPARWVNGWDAIQLHQTKPVQLAHGGEARRARFRARGSPTRRSRCLQFAEAPSALRSSSRCRAARTPGG